MLGRSFLSEIHAARLAADSAQKEYDRQINDVLDKINVLLEAADCSAKAAGAPSSDFFAHEEMSDEKIRVPELRLSKDISRKSCWQSAKESLTALKANDIASVASQWMIVEALVNDERDPLSVVLKEFINYLEKNKSDVLKDIKSDLATYLAAVRYHDRTGGYS